MPLSIWAPQAEPLGRQPNYLDERFEERRNSLRSQTRVIRPPITRKILFQALEREVGYLREEISEKPRSEWRDVAFYRAYAVLTLCRILYSLKSGTVVSKQRAARWAIKHLPDEWSEIIVQALESDAGKRRAGISLFRIRRFIDSPMRNSISNPSPAFGSDLRSDAPGANNRVHGI
jgi:hypothetical protein